MIGGRFLSRKVEPITTGSLERLSVSDAFCFHLDSVSKEITLKFCGSTGTWFPLNLLYVSENSYIAKYKAQVGEHEKIPYQRRDTWWRESLRPTPIPGFYPIRGFLEEAQLKPVKATYNFKGEGRKKASIYEQLPDLTLPNAFMYYPPSFVELAEKRPATYSFKSTSRQNNYPVNRDKNINTDPGQYDLFPRPIPTFPTKSYMFRSAVQRHPVFPLKQGPGPGEYEIKDVQPVPIRSSFISKVPRILPAHTKVPGPGYYWPTKQAPRQPRTIASLGREHTIFFSNVPEF